VKCYLDTSSYNRAFTLVRKRLENTKLAPLKKISWLKIMAKILYKQHNFSRLLPLSNDVFSLGQTYDVKGYKEILYYKFFALFGLGKYDLALKTANKKQDVKLCTKINDSFLKDNCTLDIFNKNYKKITDIKYCDIFTGELSKNDCTNKINENLTKNTMVVKSCTRFEDSIQNYQCKRDVILRNAEQWINKCNLAKDDLLKNECLSKLNISLWVKEKTLKYCESNKKDVLSIDFCKQNIINELNKSEETNKYCELYTNSKLKVEQCKQFNTNGGI